MESYKSRECDQNFFRIPASDFLRGFTTNW